MVAVFCCGAAKPKQGPPQLAIVSGMTVGVAVKVFDGLVLATDSATTVDLGAAGHQVYNSANKIFHLHRHHPVAAMTWGLGNVGSASIATLAKDLRRRLMGSDSDYSDWALDESYTVKGVADRLIEMVFDELYAPEFAGQPGAPLLGFLVAGYSARESQAEAWLVQMDDPDTRPVAEQAVAGDQSGWLAYAQPEAAIRLFKGFDPNILGHLAAALTPQELQKVEQVLTSGVMERPVVIPAMPFADAINFAKYVVDTTVGYTRYVLGPDTVGGQVEVAGISRHEGFKWISRKHYYSQSLNPRTPDHDH